MVVDGSRYRCYYYETNMTITFFFFDDNDQSTHLFVDSYGLMVVTHQHQRPSSTAPMYSTLAGTSSTCGYRCHVDATCYALGVKQVSGGKWLCDFYGQLAQSEVYVDEMDYQVFEPSITIHDVV